MTIEERNQLTELKDQTALRLQSSLNDLHARYSYALNETDPRITEYVSEVINNPSGHNLYEILGVARFFKLLDRFDWKAGKVRKFFKFYELLKFNGQSGRRRYRLTPVQCFQFANIFGFYDSYGRRVIRTAYIFVPRKFSKTTSAASLAVYDMLFGDNNAQAFVGANSYEQAKICFDEIRNIMRDLDPGERHFRVNREKIHFLARGRDSFIRCLTANAKTQDGLNASLVIMDEYAQARNTAGKNGADLKNVLTSSMGVRKEPLTVIITTASEVIDGPFAHELDGVKKVLRGEAQSDTIFASLFMPDVGDAEDDPATWAKVQPHLGITVQHDYYAKEWDKAKLSADDRLVFRTKLLNIFAVNETKSWFTLEKARELTGAFNIDRIEGRPYCAVAFDLSVHDDFSAVSYTLYSSNSKRFYSHTDYYFPEGALKGHPNEQLYRIWAEQGYLKLCSGDCIDVRMIASDIFGRADRVNIIGIGYDSYKAQELVNLLSTMGASEVLSPYSQTFGSFNLPVESFELMAYSSPPKITINDNPINVYCLTNSLIMEDTLENKKPVKISHNRKIDGVITMLMTIGMLNKIER
ncbi:terminase large subunit [uncultured Duncaniella sp.]|uniref:terminase large subunit domain-containing protein n=1 Tax=uncultured Duncaniella sp. TaxID=2768039 RepID=UPI0026756565|nr:terminase large subunit [uncultured Duncaniella sp.]